MTPAAIRFSAANPDDVYVAFGRGFGPYGIFYSADGGASWLDRRPGLPSGPLTDLAFDGNTVYVAGGIGFGHQYVGLCCSTDKAATWVALSNAGATAC
jgi:hypothetical protein